MPLSAVLSYSTCIPNIYSEEVSRVKKNCKNLSSSGFLACKLGAFYMAHFKVKLKLVFQVSGSGPDFWSENLAETIKHKIFLMIQRISRTLGSIFIDLPK